MKLLIPKCPTCGGPATGTIETVSGLALLTLPDENGVCDYEGETKIWWDEQRTIYDDKGRAKLVCHQGHEWASAIEPKIEQVAA